MKNPCENCICFPICLSVYKNWLQYFPGYPFQNTRYIRNVALPSRINHCSLIRCFIQRADLGADTSIHFLHEVNDMFITQHKPGDKSSVKNE